MATIRKDLWARRAACASIERAAESAAAAIIAADAVNHPKHYPSDPSGLECIEITRHRNFNIGNAIKYLWRAGLKHHGLAALESISAETEKHIEDLKKARWYIADEIKRLGGEP